MKADLRIDWCSHEAARYAVEHWHYSRALPASKLVKVGAWENGEFIGCVIFGRGASPFLGTKYNYGQRDYGQREICELVRVALNGHVTPVSRILSIAIRFLKRHCPGMRLIISFADPQHGHHGGIYQATNWIYTGESNPTTVYFWDGKWRHTRIVADKAVHPAIREAYQAGKIPTKKLPGKYRYLFPLDDETRELAMKLAKPYPTREDVAAARGESKEGVAPGPQPGEGVSTRPRRSKSKPAPKKSTPKPKPVKKPAAKKAPAKRAPKASTKRR